MISSSGYHLTSNAYPIFGKVVYTLAVPGPQPSKQSKPSLYPNPTLTKNTSDVSVVSGGEKSLQSFSDSVDTMMMDDLSFPSARGSKGSPRTVLSPSSTHITFNNHAAHKLSSNKNNSSMSSKSRVVGRSNKKDSGSELAQPAPAPISDGDESGNESVQAALPDNFSLPSTMPALSSVELESLPSSRAIVNILSNLTSTPASHFISPPLTAESPTPM